MRRLAKRASALIAALVALAAALPSIAARADPVAVYPGMEIRQDAKVCTLGYVDLALRVAYTAGHCRGSGTVTDKDGNVIGHLAAFRDNTPNGSTVNTDQVITDYEAIALTDDVAANDILPGGRPLISEPRPGVELGEAVCHFGIVTGQSCGNVEAVNNGWFTMAHGVVSQRGDSGGPVYVIPFNGPAHIVGLFNSTWGDLPAAVSWSATSQEVREDLGLTTNANALAPPA